MRFKSSGSRIKSFFMLKCLRIDFQDVFFTISVAVIGHKSHGKLTLFTKPLLYLSRLWVLKIYSRTELRISQGLNQVHRL